MKYTKRYSLIKVGTCNDCSGFLPIKHDKCSECTAKRDAKFEQEYNSALTKALEAGYIFQQAFTHGGITGNYIYPLNKLSTLYKLNT